MVQLSSTITIGASTIAMQTTLALEKRDFMCWRISVENMQPGLSKPCYEAML
jgi:hypothetical protein